MLHALQAKAILLPETVAELEAVLKSREMENPQLSTTSRMDKRQIEHRIEEDRERHKRLRESIWAVDGEEEKEMERLWDEASEIGEDDFVVGREDSEERRQAVAFG